MRFPKAKLIRGGHVGVFRQQVQAVAASLKLISAPKVGRMTQSPVSPPQRKGAKESPEASRFRQEVLVHFDLGYNLARWLVGNGVEAEDVMQEATIRAFRAFSSVALRDTRAWFLQIVRNVSHTQLQRGRRNEPLDEILEIVNPEPSAETLLIDSVSASELHAAIETLPVQYREAIILREIEGLSYLEIAQVADVPEGTVMSRLARGRSLLRKRLLRHAGRDAR